MRRSLAPSLLAALALSAGCAAPSFVAQTGRVTPRHGVRVSLGAGYQVNTSAASVVRDGRDLARALDGKRTTCPDLASQDCWSVEDVRPVVRAGMKLAVTSPLSVSTALAARYGLARGVDVGLRFGPGQKGADLGLQLHGPRDATTPGWAGSLFAGWGKRDMGTLGAAIEDVLHGEASQDDLSVTYVAGRQFRDVGHLYLGARYVASRWKVQVIPDIPLVYDGAASQRALLGTDASGWVHHAGGVVGGAIGWRKVFLGAELNVLGSTGRATVLFEDVSFAGVGVMPAVYLYGQL